MIAFLFAGQGSPAIGMGQDLYDSFPEFKGIFDSYPSIRDLIFNGTIEELSETKNTQKAIVLTSYAIAKLLEVHGIIPAYVAGLSLGEYSALAFSEAWSLDDAISIATKRGQIMNDALPKGKTGMRAVIGVEENIIRATLDKAEGVCEIANLNCPGQVVITGDISALEMASQEISKASQRARIVPLNVSGAFHSTLLYNASLELSQVLSKYKNKKPNYKVLYNYVGDESNLDLNTLLSKQIYNPVYFEKTIRSMISKGVDTFIEIGPGKALSGFVKKIDRNVKIYTINDLESLTALIGGR